MPITMRRIIPIFRSFDEAKAKSFYLNYLGFKIDWEHRFEPSLPLYMQVSRDSLTIHLSEHHGDCTPGAALRMDCEQLDEFWAELKAKNYANASPTIETMPWDMREMRITDPFGNRLIFCKDC
jgi:uncharacterized glyoxalase superfamily protein PhnB